MSLGDLFAQPTALPCLLLVPLVWLGLRTLDRVRARRLARLVGPRTATLTAELGPGRRALQRALFTAALALQLIALMQPCWGLDRRRVEQRAVDLVVCLDVSRSMLARDLPPTRLGRAHQEIRALAERARGDRLGLVAFAGEARLKVPLTRDMDTFAALAEETDPLSIRRGGTDLGAALEQALAALDSGSDNLAAIVLISDGEDHAQRGLRAAMQCKERGIPVHCVGLGSAIGGKIPLPDAHGEAFLRTRAGEEVVSVMDAAGLRRVAATTGGTFVDAADATRPLRELYERRILEMARGGFARGERLRRQNRYRWPLLPAFLLLVLQLCLTDRRGRRSAID